MNILRGAYYRLKSENISLDVGRRVADIMYDHQLEVEPNQAFRSFELRVEALLELHFNRIHGLDKREMEISKFSRELTCAVGEAVLKQSAWTSELVVSVDGVIDLTQY